jgi:hypothetical protein
MSIEGTFDLVSMLVDKNLQYVETSDSYALYNDWIGVSLELLDF